MSSVPPEKRAKWRKWAEEEIGGDDLTIDAATDAIIAALLQGSSVEEAMTAGRGAASARHLSGARVVVDKHGRAVR